MCSPTWERLRLPRKGREPMRRTLSWPYVGNFDTIPYRGIAVSPIPGFEYFSSQSFPTGTGEENSIECAKASRIDFTLFAGWGSFHFAARDIAACTLAQNAGF